MAYAVGIYYLNLLLLFLTPSIDPALEDDDDGPVLPSKTNDEFRPFMRRLPEFKCWYVSAFRERPCAVLLVFLRPQSDCNVRGYSYNRPFLVRVIFLVFRERWPSMLVRVIRVSRPDPRGVLYAIKLLFAALTCT